MVGAVVVVCFAGRFSVEVVAAAVVALLAVTVVAVVIVVVAAVVMVVAVVEVVVAHVLHITGQFNCVCLPTKVLRPQSEMLYVAPQSGGSGFPLHIPVVVVVEVVTAVEVVVAKHMPHVVGQTC